MIAKRVGMTIFIFGSSVPFVLKQGFPDKIWCQPDLVVFLAFSTAPDKCEKR
jgi:hypothetical protein